MNFDILLTQHFLLKNSNPLHPDVSHNMNQPDKNVPHNLINSFELLARSNRDPCRGVRVRKVKCYPVEQRRDGLPCVLALVFLTHV